MKIRSIVHKGLRRLYEQNSSKGLSADTVDKIRKMLTYWYLFCEGGYPCLLIQKQSILAHGFQTITPLKYILISFLLLVFGYGLYRIAVNAAQDLGLFFRAGIDLYRMDLLKQLHRELPGNLADERNTWLDLSTFFISGDRLTWDEAKMKHPPYVYHENHDTSQQVETRRQKVRKSNPNIS